MGKFENKIGNVIKIMSCISVLGFSVVSITAAAIAWISANRRVSNNGINTRLDNYDVNTEYYLYQYDLTDVSNITAKGDTKETRLFDFNNFEMHSYDTIFATLNKFTYSMIRVEVSGADFPTSGTITAELFRNTSVGNDSTNLAPYFTSGIRFSCSIDKNLYNSDAGTLFSNSVEYFKGVDPNYEHFEQSDDNSKIFPTNSGTIEEPNWSKPDSIAFEFAYTPEDFSNGSLNLYIFIEYEIPLISNFSNTSISSGGVQANEVTLEDDLEKLKMTYTA